MKKLKIYKPLESWQIFHFIREKLGYHYLLHLYGYRNSVKIATWCMDPRERLSAIPNPIDKLQIIIEDLNNLGYRDIAIQIIKILVRPLNLEVKDQHIESTKDPLQELLDLPSAVGEIFSLFQKALADGELSYEEILQISQAIDELIKEASEFKTAINKFKGGADENKTV